MSAYTDNYPFYAHNDRLIHFNTLPDIIEIQVIENPLGHVLLKPCSELHRHLLCVSNQYDNTCDVYLQREEEIKAFKDTTPDALYYDEYLRDKAIDSGKVISVDTYEYMYQWLGGQSG